MSPTRSGNFSFRTVHEGTVIAPSVGSFCVIPTLTPLLYIHGGFILVMCKQ